MPECQVSIRNRLGLHARASAQLVRLSTRFHCDIYLRRDGMEVNAKSIMGVLLLAAPAGSTLTLRTEGVDADAAMQAITELFANKFGEDH